MSGSLLADRLPEAVLPDYRGGGLLNLLAWIEHGQGASPQHPILRTAPEPKPRTVLCLFDGLGDAYLCGPGRGSRLHAARLGSLTSVFPSTTAAAITTAMTGLAPAEHGLNGWVCRGHGPMGLFEPLPLRYCQTGKPVRGFLRRRRLFPYRTLYQRIPSPAVVISPGYLIDSDFSSRHSRGAAVGGYDALDELPELLGEALERFGDGGFVYVYLPHFDATAHDEGMSSLRLYEVFEQLDECFAGMAAVARRASATLLATADHGLIDAPEDDIICLGAIPQLIQMLAQPIWGERRAAFCAVRPEHRDEFAAAIEASWPGRIDILTGEQVLASQLLGPGAPHRDLATRVGDFLLLPRGSGTVVDAAEPSHVHRLRAVHGGLSADEMRIPLIAV